MALASPAPAPAAPTPPSTAPTADISIGDQTFDVDLNVQEKTGGREVLMGIMIDVDVDLIVDISAITFDKIQMKSTSIFYF